jgi:hypothetical protein
MLPGTTVCRSSQLQASEEARRRDSVTPGTPLVVQFILLLEDPMEIVYECCCGLDIHKKQDVLADSDGSENEAYCARGRWSMVVPSLVL